MNKIISCIENLRSQLERRRREDPKEFPTRTIFIDPMLEALGWDVRDPDSVRLEYPTIGGGHVDYAAKINGKPVLYIEAKAINEPLDVRAIVQVVSYAVNDGVEWCILTNGVIYKVYHSTEKGEAPEKLLFEVSIDPKDSEGSSIEEIAEKLNRFSMNAMAQGLLDEIGEGIFTLGKVRKALDKLFMDSPSNLIRVIRSVLNDDTVKPQQIKKALQILWTQSSELPTSTPGKVTAKPTESISGHKEKKVCDEEHHIKNIPLEVVELYRTLDKFCKELDPQMVQKKYRQQSINYIHGKKAIFCCVYLLKGGLRVWLKLRYSDLVDPPAYARDVSNIGHWGVGDVEIAIDDLKKLQASKQLIVQSFEKNKQRNP